MTGRRRSHTPQADNTELQDGRLIRIALLMISVYLFVGFMPMMRWSAVNHSWLPLAFHVCALAASVYFGLGELPRKFRPIRDWSGLILVGFMYFDLRFLVGGMALSKKDDRIAALDRALFGGDLWHTLAQRMHSLPVSEFLHLAYVSYYPLIVVPPFLLWRKDRRHQFTLTLVTLIIAYLLCFTGSLAVPVDGPRFVHGPSGAPSGPFRAIALTILKLFSSKGSAFPSSHVAAAVAATYCALRFQRRIGYACLAATVGIAVGAVYGGLHYATDIVAGTGVGLIAIMVSRLIERRPSKQVEAVRRPAASDAPIKVLVMQQRMAQYAERRSRPMRPSKEVKPASNLDPPDEP